MRLSKETRIKLTKAQANILGHLGYAASKLWNECNYERNHYRELGLTEYPDWYYQKRVHKNSLWYKSLPSQSAQEVCKLLDKSWKSFQKLLKTGGIKKPRPPRYKQEKIAVTYMQNGIVHEREKARIRLSLPKQLKAHMAQTYDIHEDYLYVDNVIFGDMNNIKQVKLYPPQNDLTCRIIVIYEVEDTEKLSDNGKYLSIDLGLHNLMTCYSAEGRSFIVGRKYLAICRKFDKEIAKVQSQWEKLQARKGVKYPKSSKHILRLYEKKRHAVKDYLHKMTHYIAQYCDLNAINTVVIGDITGIREENDLGAVMNQKLHSLPYGKLYQMLDYKLRCKGIRFEKQEEAWTSQCSPRSQSVSKACANKTNRQKRGLYKEAGNIWNADAVGAYNILRKNKGMTEYFPIKGLSNPEIIKVAV